MGRTASLEKTLMLGKIEGRRRRGRQRMRWLDGITDSMDMLLLLLSRFSYVRLSATPWTAEHQASLSFTVSRVCSNSCPLSQWCHPTILSSVIPFSSQLQSFPASGSFLVSQVSSSESSEFLASGGPSIGVSASTSVLPMNIQDWFPQGTLRSLLQHHSSKASILQHSALFIVQLSHPYMTTGKTIVWLYRHL